MQYGAIDTEAGLRLALDRLAAVDPPPQALVFTGDLADKAEPAAYARLREIVEPAAAAMGAEVVWVMGNHDERADYSLRALRRGVRRSAGPGARDRRPADHLARQQRAGLPPRRAHRRAAGVAGRRAGDAGRARHPARAAPPADPAADAAGRRADRAARAGPSRGRHRGLRRARDPCRATCTSRRTPSSPASPSRSPRRAATPATRRRSTASCPGSTRGPGVHDGPRVRRPAGPHDRAPRDRDRGQRAWASTSWRLSRTSASTEARELASNKTSPFNVQHEPRPLTSGQDQRPVGRVPGHHDVEPLAGARRW